MSNFNNVTAADFAPRYATTGFECSMDGYKQLTLDVVDLLIFYIPMAKSVFKAVLPADLRLALDHLYYGLTGANAWIGYAVAAGYYMALDQGYGDRLCEASGYVAVVAETLHKAVDWQDTNVKA